MKALLLLVSAIRKPLHLEIVTIQKIRPNSAKMKVQTDLATYLPKFVLMVVVNVSIGPRRTNNIRIQYDDLSKYCKERQL